MRWLVVAAVLLAGCASPDEGPSPSPSASSSTGDGSSFSGTPGLEVDVVHRADGRDHTLDAVARNTGAATLWYLWVPQCGLNPWTETMEGPSGRVEPREPEAHCQPCGWDDLQPGESLTYSLAWDERLWDYDAQAMRDAPEGRYRWTLTFGASVDPQQACAPEVVSSDGVSIDVSR